MSGFLDALPPLPDITGRSAAPSASTGNSGGSSGSTIGDAMQGVASKAFSIAFLGGMSVQSVVFIFLGLLLIAAGIFAFKEVRNTTVQAVKTGGKAAAAAAL